MNVMDKLAEVFYEAAGVVFPGARVRYFESRARESFGMARALMGGSKDSGVRDALLRETGKPQSPWLAKLYYQYAQEMFGKTGRASDDPSYREVFGVTQEEFNLDIYKAILEIKFPNS